jgi:hypothetical protein
MNEAPLFEFCIFIFSLIHDKPIYPFARICFESRNMYLSPNGRFMKLMFTLIFSLFVFKLSAQRVGIGITTPLEKLHVDSNIKIGLGPWSPLLNNNRYLKFGDGDNVTIGEVGLDDRLVFSAKEFVFRNSIAHPGEGRVGINITGSPTAHLEINGNVKITDGTHGEYKVLTSAADGTASWQKPAGRDMGFHTRLQSAVQSVPTATDYLINFDSETFDDGFMYNNASGIFTASDSGVYQFNVKIEWQLESSTSGVFSVFLEVNGTKREEIREFVNGTAGNDIKTLSFGTHLKLLRLDVVKVYVRQETGVNQSVLTGNSSFSGHFIYRPSFF